MPFNFFGGAGSITQAMMDFVGFVQHDSSSQKTWDFTGNITGKLFELPGGPLGIAAGVEYRKLTGRFDPDPVVTAGFSSDIPAQPTKGGYNVKEVGESTRRFGTYLAPNCSKLTRLPATRAIRNRDRSRPLRAE